MTHNKQLTGLGLTDVMTHNKQLTGLGLTDVMTHNKQLTGLGLTDVMKPGATVLVPPLVVVLVKDGHAVGVTSPVIGLTLEPVGVVRLSKCLLLLLLLIFFKHHSYHY